LTQIQLRLHERQGAPVSNFAEVLGPPEARPVLEPTKDPYVFDFLELAKDAQERDLEQALIDDIQNFLIELGSGFAFYGRQRALLVGERLALQGRRAPASPRVVPRPDQGHKRRWACVELQRADPDPVS